jgi:hypothetical protein
MEIKKAIMLVTNIAIKKLQQDNSEYAAVGLLSMDGQKFDISVRDYEIYSKLSPMTKVVLNLDLTNSKYGIKLSIKDIIEIGNAI